MTLSIYSLYRGLNTLYLFIKISNNNIKQVADQLNIWRVDKNVKVYLFVYSLDQIDISTIVNNSNICIVNINKDLTYLIDIINIKNNYFFKYCNPNIPIKINLIKTLYKQLNNSSIKHIGSHHINEVEKSILLFNEFVDFVNTNKELVSDNLKHYCLYKNINVQQLGNLQKTHTYYLKNFNNLYLLINNLIQTYEKIDYKSYLDYNIISIYSRFTKIKYPIIEQNVLTNVYYYKKTFYDNNGIKIIIPFLENDFEYNQFIGQKCYHNDNIVPTSIDVTNISNLIQIPDKNMLYLDYIYNFYNFGEFWDIVHRLVALKNPPEYKLFHLRQNRVENINFFFNNVGVTFPNPNSKHITYHKNNTTYLFNQIHFLNIYNICRGWIDNFFAFTFNLNYNKLNPDNNKNYCLYLKRGKFGREILNENLLIDNLKILCKNFVAIDGTEKYEQMVHYWTNAVFVVGAHGSLFKNMIYCKKNPIFIELTPDRHPCFYGNATHCNFGYFYINFKKDSKENIILSKEDLNMLIQLIECVAPS